MTPGSQGRFTPSDARAWIDLLVRDIAFPVAGLYLLVHNWATLEPWHLPLIGGLCSVPLIGRGGRVKVPELPRSEES